MIHPCTNLVTVSESVGHGVIATEMIPRGTITWVRDRFDTIVRPGDRIESQPMLQDALFRNAYRRADGCFVLTWDHAKFMNHSCEANIAIICGDLEIAVRDIEPGEQLTNDYAAMYLDEDEPFVCACGALSCRRTVSPLDAVILSERWENDIEAALAYVDHVRQPLRSLIDDVHEAALLSFRRLAVVEA